MGFRYAILGAGRQGVASAYDLIQFGKAEEVLLIDIDKGVAEAGVEHINRLIDRKVATAVQADAGDVEGLVSILEGVTAFISGVHYPQNPSLTDLAIHLGAHMCDFGGNNDVVREQLQRDAEAKASGVTVVPDCGMGPGLNISLATYAMSLVDNPREVFIWDGGLPQDPKPPWNFLLTFHIDGLTNEYSGNAYYLRNGKITEVPCFDGYEVLSFPPPIGKLEAFVTSGGLSTAPWTFQGKLKRLENKTLRYPGHWEQFRAFRQLGLFEREPIAIDGKQVVPRDVFHALLEPKVTQHEIRDMGVMRIKCIGEKDGRRAEAIVELIDYYDEQTGFTAMQRLTGWHASIIAILAAQGKVQRGAVPVELAVPGSTIVEEARRRGFIIEEQIVTVE